MEDIVSRLIFAKPPPSYTAESFPDELIYIPKILELRERCPPEQRVPCLFLKYPSARFLIIYFHSNAEDLGKCYTFLLLLREQFQVHVLAVEYPGYGICPGGPATADTVTENAFVVFRFVREVMKWPTDGIKILGRSIGTGPAVALAVQYKVAGLILIAPFLSVKELAKDLVGILSFAVEERFPSKDRIHLVRSPVLIIHGQKDKLIPCRHGVDLYELTRSRKLLISPECMEHNTHLLTNAGFFVLPMLQFFGLPDYCFEDIEVPAWVSHSGYEPALGVVTSRFAKSIDVLAPPRQSPKVSQQARDKENGEVRNQGQTSRNRDNGGISSQKGGLTCVGPNLSNVRNRKPTLL